MTDILERPPGALPPTDVDWGATSEATEARRAIRDESDADAAAPRLGPALMIVHAYYDEDPRVRREAETLAASGRAVTVIGLRRPGDEATGRLDGVDVIRLDVQRHQGAGIGTYLREYAAFGLAAARTALRLHRRTPFAIAQVHSPPDALVFATLPLRLLRVPVIVDLHEAMPEFFKSRFPRAAHPIAYRLLHLQERLSIAYASTTLSVNDAMRDRLLRLGIRPEDVTVVPNDPVLWRFDPADHQHRPFRADGSLRLVYAGALTPTYELDVAVRAVALLAGRRPDLDVQFDVYGRGDREADLRALADELGIGDRIRLHGRIAIEAVPAAIAAADIGVAPTRLDDFTLLTMSTKIHEYAAMRKPVVATRLPMVARTFPPGSIALVTSGDVGDLAAAIERLADDPSYRTTAIEAAAGVVRARAWERQAPAYVALVDRLARDPAPVGPRSRRVGEPGTVSQATPSRR